MYYDPSGYSGVKGTDCPPGSKINGTGSDGKGSSDIGHITGHEFWRERDKAEGLGWSQSQFNEQMNKSDLYQFDNPSPNRSHKHEDKN